MLLPRLSSMVLVSQISLFFLYQSNSGLYRVVNGLWLILQYPPKHIVHCSLLLPCSLPLRNYYQLNYHTVADVSVSYAINGWGYLTERVILWCRVTVYGTECLISVWQDNKQRRKRRWGQKASLSCHCIWFCWHCVLFSRSWFHCFSRFLLPKSNKSICPTNLHWQLFQIRNIEGYVFGLALYRFIVLTYLAFYKISVLIETVCGI